MTKRRMFAFVGTLALALACACAGAEKVWKGMGGGYLSGAENWEDGTAPQPGDVLTFGGDANQEIIVDLDPETYWFSQIKFTNGESNGKTGVFTFKSGAECYGLRLKRASSAIDGVLRCAAHKYGNARYWNVFDVPVTVDDMSNDNDKYGFWASVNHGVRFLKTVDANNKMFRFRDQCGPLEFAGTVTNAADFAMGNSSAGDFSYLQLTNHIGGARREITGIHRMPAMTSFGTNWTELVLGKTEWGVESRLVFTPDERVYPERDVVTEFTYFKVNGVDAARPTGGLLNENSNRRWWIKAPLDATSTAASSRPQYKCDGALLLLGGAGDGRLEALVEGTTEGAKLFALRKEGAGTWSIAGTWPGTNSVTVAGGGFVFDADYTASGSGKVTVKSGATLLGGDGTVAAPLVLETGAKAANDGAKSVLCADGATATFAADSVLRFRHLGNGVFAGLKIPGGKAVLNGRVKVELDPEGEPLQAGTHVIMAYGSTEGVGSVVQSGGFPANAFSEFAADGLKVEVRSAAASARWVGGGADAKLTTAANWSGGERPDFSSGWMNVAVDGSASAMVVDADLQFANLTIEEGTGDFAITSEGGKPLWLKGGEFKVEGARTVTVEAPVKVGGAVKFTVADAAGVLKVSGSIGSTATHAIETSGYGTVELSGDNTFTGELTISEGTLKALHERALGSAAGKTVLLSPYPKGGERGGYPKLSLDVARCDEPMEWHGNDKDDRVIFNGDGSETGELQLGGKITIRTANVRTTIGAKLKVLWHMEEVDASPLYLFSGLYSRTTIVFEKRMGGSYYYGTDAVTVFKAPGNFPNYGTLFLGGRGALRAEADEMFNPIIGLSMNNMNWCEYGGLIDLNGHNGTAGVLSAPKVQRNKRPEGEYVKPAEITSAAPAEFKLRPLNQDAHEKEFYGRFTGAVSFDYGLAASQKLTITTNSTTFGDLTVSGGTLEFAEGGRWENGTNVVVKGGVLSLARSGAFNRDYAEMRVTEPGKVVMAAGTKTTVRGLYVNGVKKRSQTYRAADLPGILEGEGELEVLPKFISMAIILR